MTVRDWLERERHHARRVTTAATALAACGAAATLLVAGVVLDRVGVYRRAPEIAVAIWLALGGVLAAARRVARGAGSGDRAGGRTPPRRAVGAG
jgi:hypothetical protein